MNGHQAEGQELFGLVEMANVSAAVVLAGVAAAAFFQRRPIFFIFLILHIHAPGVHHGHAISCHAGRKYAVKHIDAASHALHQAVRRAHAHEVAGLIHREPLGGVFQDVIHQVMRLAHRETADGQAIKGHGRNFLGASLAQVLVHAALHDAKHAAVRSRMRLDTALGPSGRPRGGLVRILIVRRIGDAFIKGHGDVTAQIFLGMNGHLRRKELFRAVQERAEMHALFRDFSHSSQAEYLESAAISQDALGPIHEMMQLARFLDQLCARAQEEMIGIRQDDLRSHILQFFRRHGLHRRLRPYGHEHRCFKCTMWRVEKARASAGLLVLCHQFVMNNHIFSFTSKTWRRQRRKIYISASPLLHKPPGCALCRRRRPSSSPAWIPGDGNW